MALHGTVIFIGERSNMPAPFIYNPDIPQAIDQPSQSQGEILQNFTSINEIWDVNHYTFASVNGGKHKFVQMPQQAIKPVILANEMALYTKDVGGTPEMFIERGNGAQVEIPFTQFSESACAGGTYSRGYAYLPSGLLMKWGVTDAATPGTPDFPPNTIPFNRTIDTSVQVPGSPDFGAARFTVMLTGRLDSNVDINLIYYVRSIDSNNTFTVRAFSRTGGAVPMGTNYSFAWTAIGPGV